MLHHEAGDAPKLKDLVYELKGVDFHALGVQLEVPGHALTDIDSSRAVRKVCTKSDDLEASANLDKKRTKSGNTCEVLMAIVKTSVDSPPNKIKDK